MFQCKCGYKSDRSFKYCPLCGMQHDLSQGESEWIAQQETEKDNTLPDTSSQEQKPPIESLEEIDSLFTNASNSDDIHMLEQEDELVEMDAEKCSSCGSRVRAEAVVCPYCGVALGEATAEPTQSTDEKGWSGSAFIAILIAAAFLPFIGMILGAWAMAQGGKQRTQGGLIFAVGLLTDLIWL